MNDAAYLRDTKRLLAQVPDVELLGIEPAANGHYKVSVKLPDRVKVFTLAGSPSDRFTAPRQLVRDVKRTLKGQYQ